MERKISGWWTVTGTPRRFSRPRSRPRPCSRPPAASAACGRSARRDTRADPARSVEQAPRRGEIVPRCCRRFLDRHAGLHSAASAVRLRPLAHENGGGCVLSSEKAVYPLQQMRNTLPRSSTGHGAGFRRLPFFEEERGRSTTRRAALLSISAAALMAGQLPIGRAGAMRLAIPSASSSCRRRRRPPTRRTTRPPSSSRRNGASSASTSRCAACRARSSPTSSGTIATSGTSRCGAWSAGPSAAIPTSWSTTCSTRRPPRRASTSSATSTRTTTRSPRSSAARSIRAKRKALVGEAQEMVAADAPYVFLVHPKNVVALSGHRVEAGLVVDQGGIGIRNFWTFVAGRAGRRREGHDRQLDRGAELDQPALHLRRARQLGDRADLGPPDAHRAGRPAAALGGGDGHLGRSHDARRHAARRA